MRQVFAAIGDDVLRCQVLVGVFERDEGARCLAPFFIGARNHGGLQNAGMFVQRVFDFDGGNVFTARYNNVLGSILELDIAIGMPHTQIAGMIPAAFERFIRGAGVFQIALHHHIAAEHHLAHGVAIIGHFQHGFGVAHGQIFQHRIAYPLARLDAGLFIGGQGVPFFVPVIDHGGAIGFGQAVKMRHRKTAGCHRANHAGGRRGGGGKKFNAVAESLAFFRFGVDQHAHHHRRAAHMGDLVFGDGVINQRRLGAAQADMCACRHTQRPGKAPAVAMEHRQRPQIDGMLLHGCRDHIAHRQQIGPAMMEHHALRIAGGARRVVQRNRVPFIAGQRPFKSRIALGDEAFIFHFADARTFAGIFRIININHQRLCLAQGKRALGQPGKFPVHDQDFRFAMIQNKGDGRRIQPVIQRVDDRPRERHAIMRLQHLRDIGREDRHRIATANAALVQGARQPAAAGVKFGIGELCVAMHNGRLIGIYIRRAAQKTERRQRLMIGRIFVKVKIVDIGRHGGILPEHGAALTIARNYPNSRARAIGGAAQAN